MAAKCSVDVWPQKTGNQLASLIVEKNMSTLVTIFASSAAKITIKTRLKVEMYSETYYRAKLLIAAR